MIPVLCSCVKTLSIVLFHEFLVLAYVRNKIVYDFVIVIAIVIVVVDGCSKV